MYLRKHEIENPIVVEIGVGENKQKKFYEQLLGARHIGIDIRRGTPDILSDAHDSKTMKILKEMLGGKPINILFIDAWHYYKDVKKEYEMYSPLCTDIVAFHDVERDRHRTSGKSEVWKLWDEMKSNREYGASLFFSIYQNKGVDDRQMGIGVLIKNV